jgi:SAM-dependent methyltransferase
MTQRDAFLSGEGDAWFERNRGSLEATAPGWLLEPIVTHVGPQSSVLEIGCGNGRNLAWLRAETGCAALGVDPSEAAIQDGRQRHPGVRFELGTADDLPTSDMFDFVLVGFCLYLCDRRDLTRIVAEVDRVLAANGHLAIIDFDPSSPRRRPYRHREGITSFKMDYMRLFLAFPHFQLVSKHVGTHDGPSPLAADSERIAITIARKDLAAGYTDEFDL